MQTRPGVRAIDMTLMSTQQDKSDETLTDSIVNKLFAHFTDRDASLINELYRSTQPVANR